MNLQFKYLTIQNNHHQCPECSSQKGADHILRKITSQHVESLVRPPLHLSLTIQAMAQSLHAFLENKDPPDDLCHMVAKAAIERIRTHSANKDIIEIRNGRGKISKASSGSKQNTIRSLIIIEYN